MKETDPCDDTLTSVGKFVDKDIGANPDDKELILSFTIATIASMTEETRKLVLLTSVLSITPLFPVIVAVILLIVLLLCALCCFSLVSVFICGPSDTRAKIERDILDWQTQLDKEAIVREEDHSTLKKKKINLEDRIKKFNDKLAKLSEERAALEAKINALKVASEAYTNNKETQTGAMFDKLRKEREDLAKEIKKFNTKLEKYDKEEVEGAGA